MEEKQKGLKTQAFVTIRREPILVKEIQCVLGLLLWEHIERGCRTRWLAQEGVSSCCTNTAVTLSSLFALEFK